MQIARRERPRPHGHRLQRFGHLRKFLSHPVRDACRHDCSSRPPRKRHGSKPLALRRAGRHRSWPTYGTATSPSINRQHDDLELAALRRAKRRRTRAWRTMGKQPTPSKRCRITVSRRWQPPFTSRRLPQPDGNRVEQIPPPRRRPPTPLGPRRAKLGTQRLTMGFTLHQK